MGQSEFSVAGGTGNSNASVKSAVPSFPLSPSLFSFISPRSSLAALCIFGSRALSTIQKGTACSLTNLGHIAVCNEYHKTKVISLANHNRRKQCNEPIRTRNTCNWRQARKNARKQVTNGSSCVLVECTRLSKAKISANYFQNQTENYSTHNAWDSL